MQKKPVVITSLVLFGILVCWVIFLSLNRGCDGEKPIPKPETITQAVHRLFPDVPEDEVFVQLFAEPGFEPGTVFFRKRRQVILRPDKPFASGTDKSAPMKLNITESRNVAVDGALENSLFAISGQMAKAGTASFQCNHVDFTTIDEPKLKEWVNNSSRAVIEKQKVEGSDKDAPLVVYKAVSGEFTIQVRVYYDDATKVELKENPFVQGHVKNTFANGKEYSISCDKPVIFAFCARQLDKDWKAGASPWRLGEPVKTDNSNPWEQARLIDLNNLSK